MPSTIDSIIFYEIRRKGLYPNPDCTYSDPSLQRIAKRMWELKEELARLDGLIAAISIEDEDKASAKPNE